MIKSKWNTLGGVVCAAGLIWLWTLTDWKVASAVALSLIGYGLQVKNKPDA